MIDVPETFTAKCPDCGRSLAPIIFFVVATDVVKRTCRGCRERWSIVVTPRELPGIGIASICEFTRMNINASNSN